MHVMSKATASALTTAVILCIALSASVVVAVGAESLGAFDLVAENEQLELYINPKTAEIAVRVKSTDTVWFSNPQGRDQKERIAYQNAKRELGSQVSLTYYAPDDTKRTMDSFNSSIAYEQYEIVPIDGGVRVRYTIGKQWSDTDYIPVMIGEQRFEELILSHVSSRDRRFLLNSYSPVLVTEGDGIPSDIKVPGVEDLNALFGGSSVESPGNNLTNQKLRQLIWLVIDQIMANRKDISSRGAMTAEHIPERLREETTYVLRNDLLSYDLADIAELTREVGYTPLDKAADSELYGLDAPVANIETFAVAIEYRLDRDSLIVRMPMSEVSYPDRVLDSYGEEVSYPLYSVDLLKYFGAAYTDETGYIFVPDGSGAIINLNNGKTYASAINLKVYGEDRSVRPIVERIRLSEQAYLPVYGLKKGDSAFLAIIEGGASLARIRADVAGRSNSYNTVWAEFEILPKGEATLRGDVAWVFIGQVSRDTLNVYQSRKPEEDIQVRYRFLDGDEASYAGMASAYRDYLVRTYGLSRLEDQQTPFHLELVGAVQRKRPVLGVPRTVAEPLTTFSEASEIVRMLTEAGVSNIKLRYTGWLDGGIRHSYPLKAEAESALGTVNELKALDVLLQQVGGRLYPEAGFLQVYDSGWFDGFSARNDASRYLDRKVAKSYVFDRATYQAKSEGSGYVLSPRRVPELVSSFLERYSKYSIEGLCVRYMGNQVNSDFRDDPEQLIDRGQSVRTVAGQLATIRDTVDHLMVVGGNSYVLPYADVIVELPADDSGFTLVDREVPFYQIAIHGYVDYSSKAVNTTPRTYREALLRALEYGSAPSYMLVYRDPSICKDTEYDYLMSTYYADWIAEAIRFYHEVNEVVGNCHGQVIVNHEEVQQGVYRTTYEDGTAVFVNYNDVPVDIDGMVIEAVSYKSVKGGGADGDK